MTAPQRHLSYHVYPVRGSVWRERVADVARRWELFDGVKVIAVAVDDRTDSAAEVRAMLPPDAEVREFPNDPHLGECVTWGWRWERILEAASDADYILYAHAKGVTRPERHFHEWGEKCFTALTDHWPLVERQMRTRPICGVFKLEHGFGWCGVENCDWHYSGTHYWVRAAVARFAGTALAPSAGRWAVEAWPGGVFKSTQAGYVGLSPTESAPDRNTAEGWAVVKAAWERWERFAAFDRLNLGSGPFYAADWVNVDLDPAHRADLREDVSTLPSIRPASVGEIYAGHVAEHVADVVQAFRRWREVLVPGGVLTVVVPDGERSVRHWLTGATWPGIDMTSDAGLLAVATGYGSRAHAAADTRRLAMHRRVFDRSTLEACLLYAGFEGVEVVVSHPLMVRSVTDVGWQLALRAVAPAPV